MLINDLTVPRSCSFYSLLFLLYICTWIISDILRNKDITMYRVVYKIYYERVEGI